MSDAEKPQPPEGGLRHPIQEAEHLLEIADEGESAATPAILGGTVAAVAALAIAVVVALALGVAYVTTRGDDGRGTTGRAAAGQAVFAENCAACHGGTGHGGNGGPDLTGISSAKNLDTVLAQVRNGGGGMPPFKGTLTDEEIDDVAAYVVEEITN